MKQLLSIIVLTTISLFGVNAQNNTPRIESVNGKMYSPMHSVKKGNALLSDPATLPFIDNFETVSSMDNWTVINANGDTNPNGTPRTWIYVDMVSIPDADGGVGLVQVGTPFPTQPELNPAEDYLISLPIIIPSAGNYNISFYANPYGSIENLKILYGTSPNPAEMNLLDTYVLYLSDYMFQWKITVKNFYISTPGNYHFAFLYQSNSQNGGSALNIDKIMIAAGVFVGTPDITFDYVLPPVSSCVMGNEVLGAIVHNVGSEPITEFTLTYQIENGTPVSQTFTQTIGLDAKATVYFTQTADFSAIGDYNIHLTVSTPNEENTENNEAEVIVKHYAPITTLPFHSNFSNAADRADWYPTGVGAWGVNEEYGCYWSAINNNQMPLLSRCITLEPETYRFTYFYSAGYGVNADNFYVAYGKSGTDPSTWQHLKDHVNAHTGDGINVEEEFALLEITETADYEFAFFPINPHGDFGVFETKVEVAPAYDFRIKNIEPPLSLARLTPVAQIEGEKIFKATLRNMGKTAQVNGNINLKYKDNELSSENFAFKNVGEVIQVDLKPVFGFVSPETMLFKFHVSIDGGLSKDWEISKTVVDSTFAHDFKDANFDNGVGSNMPCVLGMVYELSKKDVLTTIDIGFYEYPPASSSDIALAVYHATLVDDDLTIGEMIFEVVHPRTLGNNAKAMTLDVPNTLLLPGQYYIAVKQLNNINIAVVYDLAPKGYYFVYVPETNYIRKETYFGNIHLRPNFGLDIISPKVGEGVNADNLTQSSVSLEWEAASDNKTPQTNLPYYVYQSFNNNISTTTECEENGTLLNEGGTLNLTSYEVNNLTPGGYYFNVVVADEAGNKAAYTAKFVELLTINNLLKNNLKIYPNPSRGIMEVEWVDMIMDEITIYNAMGTVIYSFSNINSSFFKLNTQSLSSGLYFISVKTQEGILSSKFIVE